MPFSLVYVNDTPLFDSTAHLLTKVLHGPNIVLQSSKRFVAHTVKNLNIETENSQQTLFAKNSLYQN